VDQWHECTTAAGAPSRAGGVASVWAVGWQAYGRRGSWRERGQRGGAHRAFPPRRDHGRATVATDRQELPPQRQPEEQSMRRGHGSRDCPVRFFTLLCRLVTHGVVGCQTKPPPPRACFPRFPRKRLCPRQTRGQTEEARSGGRLSAAPFVGCVERTRPRDNRTAPARLHMQAIATKEGGRCLRADTPVTGMRAVRGCWRKGPATTHFGESNSRPS